MTEREPVAPDDISAAEAVEASIPVTKPRLARIVNMRRAVRRVRVASRMLLPPLAGGAEAELT
jgi:hypothetical protein